MDDDDCVHIVSIEGGIGAGKSTAMEAIQARRPSLFYIDEPVKQWERSGLLAHMYKKSIPPGTFQIAALATRMAPLLKAVRKGHRVIVTERCAYSDFEVFTKTNLETGSIELTAYKMAYDALLTAMPKRVHLHVIYLRATVDTLLSRIRARNRPAERVSGDSEAAARLSYLKELHEHHESFFMMTAEELGVFKCSRHVVNAGQPAEAVADAVVQAVSDAVPVKLEPREASVGVKRPCPVVSNASPGASEQRETADPPHT